MISVISYQLSVINSPKINSIWLDLNFIDLFNKINDLSRKSREAYSSFFLINQMDTLTLYSLYIKSDKVELNWYLKKRILH